MKTKQYTIKIKPTSPAELMKKAKQYERFQNAYKTARREETIECPIGRLIEIKGSKRSIRGLGGYIKRALNELLV